jgi:hypothetical protein
MSTKRFNTEQKAHYLIGVAVMRQFANAPLDPETRREISAVLRWIEHWLSPEELRSVSAVTGVTFDMDELPVRFN